VLARGERWLESAAAYRDAGNTRAETDALRQVPQEHPDRVPAVKRLAEILLSAIAPARPPSWWRTPPATTRSAAPTSSCTICWPRCSISSQAGHAERVRCELSGCARARRLRRRCRPPKRPPEQDGYKFLKRIPIFGRLTLGDMRDLYRLATEETWSPGDQIVRCGHRCAGTGDPARGRREVYALGPGGARI